MARSMAADDTELFRAVVTIVRTGQRWTNGEHTRTEYVGPYRTRAAALQAISRDERAYRPGWGEEVTVTGYVERSSVTWERVP